MDINQIKTEINHAITKVFDKVEEVTKVSGLKLKILNLKSKLKEEKVELADFVLKNKARFETEDEINDIFKRIEKIEKEIADKELEVASIKEEASSEKGSNEN